MSPWSPGASAPGFIAASSGAGTTSTGSGSPGASAPGFIAAYSATRRCIVPSRVTGGFGPRLHCGTLDDVYTRLNAEGSPGASAPGFIAAISCAGGTPWPTRGHRGLRPPASLRRGTLLRGRGGRHRSPGASAPGFIAATGGRCGAPARHLVTGGFGPRLHCGWRLGVEVPSVTTSHRGLRPPASLRPELRRHRRRGCGRHRGLRPPASLRQRGGARRGRAPWPVTGGFGPRLHCGLL